MRCEDCIHETVCSALIEKGLPWNDGAYPAESFCMAFRNKADFAPRSEIAQEIFAEIEKIINEPFAVGFDLLLPLKEALGNYNNAIRKDLLYYIAKLKEEYTGATDES